ncbi:MAG TPA: radical SAM/SPASM family putative metalloenzyme maturase, partial [Rectinemataceae bacterium]|nr:radical SAM/SPASM family putative metalloenzyme maturase [Rectinemataceae bacterium]
MSPTGQAPDRPFLPYPSRLIVETSSRCNLECIMCVKRSQQAPEGELDLALFRRLAPAFPRLESLVLNGIGEPLLHPGLESMVALARSSMPASARIGFQSNGSLMDQARARALIEAGLDTACISADAVTPRLFASIRRGARLSSAESAIAILDAARRDARASGFRLGLEFVAMRSNLAELPPLVSWAAERGVDFILVSQLFPYERAFAADAAYDPHLDTALSLREKYRHRARAIGQRLEDYRRVFMKYDKDEGELALVGLVDEMAQEALAAGISLRIEGLLERDDARAEVSARFFAEAERVAEGLGLSLVLPALVPRSRRECEFVEGGSAFVSWTGEVHPCYFLWHRYACYIDGKEKQVQSRSFGSLAESGILSIWQSEAFSAFRRNVMRYDYPYCFNCGFALCDYVEGGQFETDCHLNEEPCAACL